MQFTVHFHEMYVTVVECFGKLVLLLQVVEKFRLEVLAT